MQKKTTGPTTECGYDHIMLPHRDRVELNGTCDYDLYELDCCLILRHDVVRWRIRYQLFSFYFFLFRLGSVLCQMCVRPMVKPLDPEINELSCFTKSASQCSTGKSTKPERWVFTTAMGDRGAVAVFPTLDRQVLADTTYVITGGRARLRKYSRQGVRPLAGLLRPSGSSYGTTKTTQCCVWCFPTGIWTLGWKIRKYQGKEQQKSLNKSNHPMLYVPWLQAERYWWMDRERIV